MIFYLGTHQPGWLTTLDAPLFVSRRRLVRRRRLPRARRGWAADSGGFTELQLHKGYSVDAMSYSSEVRRFRDQVGKLQWAAIQDWMCEPHMVARTGLSVREHQRLTLGSYRLLRQLAPDLPWCPVLQGWGFRDYLDHLDQYGEAGFDLRLRPVVGLGSVCRRQDTGMAEELIRELHSRGLKLHAFGFKLGGLRRCAPYLASADSMAWSCRARRSAPLPGCKHSSCANCPAYAVRWRAAVLRAIEASCGARQGVLFGGAS